MKLVSKFLVISLSQFFLVASFRMLIRYSYSVVLFGVTGTYMVSSAFGSSGLD